MKKRGLRLHSTDNCIVTLNDVANGETVSWDGGEVVVKNDVTLGHKLAIVPLKAGDKVVKYGAAIGSATQDIAPGEHIHSHNLKSDAIAIFHHQDAGFKSGEQS